MLATSILSFTSESLSATLAYTTEIFGDLKLLLLIVIGLPLGFWVIRKTISLVRVR